MKIGEAIKGCSDAAFRLEREGFEGWAEAVKLGIEALKRHLANKNTWDNAWVKPLPGETKD